MSYDIERKDNEASIFRGFISLSRVRCNQRFYLSSASLQRISRMVLCRPSALLYPGKICST
jgi:hypothetical protein